jgi:GWxTD domain-containing protein
VRVAPGGAILKGQVNLDGLPEGAYTLQVTVGLGGRTTQRAAAFEMAGMEVFEKSADLIEFAQRTDEGYFGAMSEAQLDSAQAPLMYVAGSRELNTYKNLSVDAKRRFLIEFWKKRDQDKNTTINEERERFYGAIAYANEKFRVGRGKQELGWRTDRGRIYAKLGAPDETLRRNQQGLAPPYEVWRYTRGRARYYVFADRTMIGAYNLIHTNDLNENRSPGWREIITEQGVADVGRFLGEDFFREGGSSLNPIN